MNWGGLSVMVGLIFFAISFPPWSLLVLIPLIWLISRG